MEVGVLEGVEVAVGIKVCVGVDVIVGARVVVGVGVGVSDGATVGVGVGNGHDGSGVKVCDGVWVSARLFLPRMNT